MSSSKIILITGASSGIGKTCAELLSHNGHIVFGTSRKAVTGDSGEDIPFEMIRMDVNDDKSVAEAIDYIQKKHSRLDVVVNNAGMGIAGALEDTSVDELRFQFDTNLFGVFRVCKAVIPIMRQQQSGTIINVSSLAGLIGIPFQGAYSASKFALEGLTEVMRMELKAFGIQTVLVEPGDFQTGFTDSRIKTVQSQLDNVYSESFGHALAVMEHDERNGAKPDEIAKLIASIINDDSPKPRYAVGPWLQKFAVQLKKILPMRLFESIIMKTYKL